MEHGLKEFNRKCLESTLPKNYHWDRMLFDMVIQAAASFSVSNMVIHNAFHLLSIKHVTFNIRRAHGSMHEAHFFPLIGSGEAVIGLYTWKQRKMKAPSSFAVSLLLCRKYSKVTCLSL